MSSNTTPGGLLSFPLPNMKSVIMAVLRPELKAIADIYEEEIAYMRENIDRQNLLLLKIQGFFATQSSQIVDGIMKDLEQGLAIHQLQIQKVSRVDHNSLVDDVATHNVLLLQVQAMLAAKNTIAIEHMMTDLQQSLDIQTLKTQKVDRTTHNTLVDNVSLLGQSLSVYVEIVDTMKQLVDGLDGINIENINTRLNNIQNQVNSLHSVNNFQTVRIEEVYSQLLTELQEIRNELANIG